MKTFQPQQSGRGRRIRKLANASTLEFTITKCTTKLRVQVHEARKIACDNFQRAAQERVIELGFYTTQALPLRNRRILRLAHSSPMAARSPARRQRDDRAMSAKIAGKMSRGIAAQRPGNSRTTANAMPPDDRVDDSQDSLPCAGCGRAMSAPETCETTRNMIAQQPCRRPHDGQRDISQDNLLKSQGH